MALQGTDLAILSARFGVARFGVSRFGFCPGDVEGVGAEEPGEYIWKEHKPPETEWELDSVYSFCGSSNGVGPGRPTADFSDVPDPSIPGAAVQFTDLSTPTEFVSFWLWSFGDGATSNEQNPVHVYAAEGVYTVTLHISGIRGSANTSGTHTVLPPLVPHFSWTQAAEDERVDFDASASMGDITDWAWDFGDTNTDTGQTTSNNYTIPHDGTPNTFTVTLTVTGPVGSVQVQTDIVLVWASGASGSV